MIQFDSSTFSGLLNTSLSQWPTFKLLNSIGSIGQSSLNFHVVVRNGWVRHLIFVAPPSDWIRFCIICFVLRCSLIFTAIQSSKYWQFISMDPSINHRIHVYAIRLYIPAFGWLFCGKCRSVNVLYRSSHGSYIWVVFRALGDAKSRRMQVTARGFWGWFFRVPGISWRLPNPYNG